MYQLCRIQGGGILEKINVSLVNGNTDNYTAKKMSLKP
jgi:hypothetical protein